MSVLFPSIGLGLLLVLTVWLGKVATERKRQAVAAAASRMGVDLRFDRDVVHADPKEAVLDGVRFGLRRGPEVLFHPDESSASSKSALVVSFPLEVEDFVLCKVDVVDRVMGPFPAVRRLSTGMANFDQRFSAFAAEAPESPAAAGYRDAGGTSPLAWGSRGVLAGLEQVNLLWIRVKNATCEVAVANPEKTALPAVLVASANMARSLAKLDAIAVAEVKRKESVPEQLFDATLMGWVAGIMGVGPLGTLVAGLLLSENAVAIYFWVGIAIWLLTTAISFFRASSRSRT